MPNTIDLEKLSSDLKRELIDLNNALSPSQSKLFLKKVTDLNKFLQKNKTKLKKLPLEDLEMFNQHAQIMLEQVQKMEMKSSVKACTQLSNTFKLQIPSLQNQQPSRWRFFTERKKIDLTKPLNPRDNLILENCLKQYSNEIKLSRSEYYTVNINGRNMKIRLSHSLVSRPDALGNKVFHMSHPFTPDNTSAIPTRILFSAPAGASKKISGNRTEFQIMPNGKLTVRPVNYVIAVQRFEESFDTIKNRINPLDPYNLLRKEYTIIKRNYPEREARLVIREYPRGACKIYMITKNLGNNLEKMIDAPDYKKKYNLIDRLKLCEKVAEKMTALHRVNLVHCDIKLANICMDSNGEVSLIDFGSTVKRGDVMHMGTPGYFPPTREEFFGPKEPSYDVYTLVPVFFDILAGKTYSVNNEKMYDDFNGLFSNYHFYNIEKSFPKEYAGVLQKIMTFLRKCADPSPRNRPTAFDIVDFFKEMQEELLNKNEIEIPRHNQP